MSQTTSVKKNILWNMLLTMSGYIFPLLTFPYVTRVLGAGNLGVVDYALGIVDYAVLFSTLGMGMVGIRYMSQCSDNPKRRNEVFSSLVTLHALLSMLALAVYLACVWQIPSLAEHRELYYVGAAKILFNVMLVEWLFQGMQDFRYITLRTMLIRALYVIGVFVFVRSRDDYAAYFYVTIAQVAVNALVNWRYAQRYVHFRFRLCGMRELVFPVFSMGINMILLSFYTTFNVIYLGSACGSEAVGYYTTATKLYGIFISVISAYNGVFIPHLNDLYARGELQQFRETVTKSIHLVSLAALPIITIGTCLAPQIIRLVAGEGFERSVLPFQIILMQVLLVGVAQILENQVLLAFKKFREILICTATTTALAALIIILYVPTHAEVAAACAVAMPHVFELVMLYYFARKAIHFDSSYKTILRNALVCLPIVGICIFSNYYFDHFLAVLFIAGTFSVLYYAAMQLWTVKDEETVGIIRRIIKRNH
ncbi:MAG: flippase [Bacteroidaceae bacterium]|nr:flippase [Bacteroidaceae bacterium]